MLTQEMSRPPPMTSAEYYVIAAAHYDNAAKEYRLAAARFDYGDYQQSSEHAERGKGCSEKGGGLCTMATEWPSRPSHRTGHERWR